MSATAFQRLRREALKEVKGNAKAEQGNEEGQEIKEEQEKTKKEIMLELDKLEIIYNPRDKKEVLLNLLK